LKAFPEDGLKIFTEDMQEVELLPREQVLDYLEKTCADLMIPYLEHVILLWHDESSEFHNILALQYKDRIVPLMDAYINTIQPGTKGLKAGLEPGQLGELRNKLIFFLETSTSYIPERLLAHFPFDRFFEERAILLGRLGRHEQALAIYVYVLQDNSMALDYCRRNFEPQNEGYRDVYLYLLKMFLSTPDPKALGVIANYSGATEAQTGAALALLEEHANQIDTARALELLPPTTRVRDIVVFLENVLEDRATMKRSAQVLRSLLYAEHLQVQEQRMFYQKIKCIITEEKMCRVCKKRIGNSAFARYPNGVVVHYYCCKDPKVCPVD
jgi:tetratricopeptide (TPR) repeat protein